jgi:hypothetical protein
MPSDTITRYGRQRESNLQLMTPHASEVFVAIRMLGLPYDCPLPPAADHNTVLVIVAWQPACSAAHPSQLAA